MRQPSQRGGRDVARIALRLMAGGLRGIALVVLWAAAAAGQERTNSLPPSSAALLPPSISVSPETLAESLFVGDSSTQTLSIINGGTSDLTFSFSIDEPTPSHSASLTVNESIASLASRGQFTSDSASERFHAPLVESTEDDPETPAASATLALPSSPVAASLDVALLAADGASFVSDVRTKLVSTGKFASVSVIDVRLVTPTLAELSAFDAVLVWNDFSYGNAAALGNVLTQYAEGGGGVVCALFQVAGYRPLAGTWDSSQYILFEPGGYTSGNPASLGVEADPSHPILAGVESFHGGTSSFRPASSGLTAGTTLVASWSDGKPLVATRKVGAARRVDLGFFPPSSNAFSGGWAANTDGDLLLANALEWAAPAWLDVTPDSGTVPAGGSLECTVHFNASSRFGGDYDALLRVASNDPVTPEVVVPVDLHVTGVPDVALSDSLLDYGTTFTATASTHFLVVTNEGTDLLTVSLLSTNPAHFSVDPTAFSLNPLESLPVAVTFAPDAPGEFSGSLTVSSNDPDEPDLSVSLSGSGIDPPIISVGPDSLADSLFTNETSTQVLTVTNTGASPLIIGISIDMDAPLSAALSVDDVVATISSRGSVTSPRAASRTAPWIPQLRGAPARPFSAASTGLSESAVGNLDVAVLAADDAGYVQDVQDYLLATGRFVSVSVIDVSRVTPTPSELRTFDAVVVWNDYSYWDRNALGNALADYVDRGGGVVCAMLEVAGSDGLGGRWQSDGYGILRATDYYCCDFLALGVVADPAHEIMAGVDSFDGGYLSLRPFDPSLRSGSTIIARWSDGTPLVATGEVGGIRRADLGFFPPSSNASSDFWQAGTDGDLILANALEWVATSWLTVEPDTGAVSAGDTLTLGVQFNASGLFGGDYRAAIHLASNDPVTPEVTVPAVLHVTGVPDIALFESHIDFGVTYTGTTAAETLFVFNAGTDLLTVNLGVSGSSRFEAGPATLSVNPRETELVVVTFAPDSPEAFSGLLTIASNDPDEPTTMVSLAGSGLDPPVISVEPDSLDDSLLSGASTTHVLSIANSGASDLVFDAYAAGIDSPQNTLTVDEAIASLAARGIVTAIPEGSRVTPQDRDRKVAADTAAAVASVARTASPQKVGLEVALLAADADVYAADVQSQLLSTGKFASVSVIDVRFVTPTLNELQAFDAILMWSNHSYANSVALGDVMAAFVDAGGAVVCALFDVAGGPGLAGRWVSEPYTVIQRTFSRSGQASLGVVAKPTHPIMNGVSAFDGGYGSYRPGATGLVAGASLIASWSDGMPLVATRLIGSARRVDLGFFPPSSNSDPGFWQSDTDGELLLANALEWASAIWLEVAPNSGVVPAGGYVDLTVTVDANRLNGGEYRADILLNSNDPVTPRLIVPAQLHVTGIADVEVSDTQLEFGARFLNTAGLDTLVVSNEGTDELAVTVEVAAPPEFQVSTGSFSLEPGELHRLVVTFTPATTGLQSGEILLHSNDPDEPTVHVALSGSGIEPPAIDVSPGELDEHLFVGETFTRVLTLTNTGASDLVFNTTVEPGTAPTLAAGDGVAALPDLDVALLAGSFAVNYTLDVKQLLQATGKFNSVSEINVSLRTPSLTELQTFDAVLVWNDNFYASASQLGNTLADYVDAGGGVVCALYEATGNPYGRLGGRWDTGVYNVFSRGPTRSSYYESLGLVPEPRHPLMYGVNTFEGGSGSTRPGTANLTPGSTLIATWSDSMPLVACKQMPVARRVDLGFYPPSSNVRSEGWQSVSDGDLLLANALVWVSRSWVNVEPASGTVAAGSELDLAVTYDAAWLEAGDYRARLVFQSNDPIVPRLELDAHLLALPAVQGDCNGDGTVGAMDILYLVNHVFKNAPPPRGQTGDFTCDFAVTVVDVIELVHYVFKGASLETCP